MATAHTHVHQIRKGSKNSASIVDVPGWVDQAIEPAPAEEPAAELPVLSSELHPTELDMDPDSISPAPPVEEKRSIPKLPQLDTSVGNEHYAHNFSHETSDAGQAHMGTSEPPLSTRAMRRNSLAPVSPKTGHARAESSTTAQSRARPTQELTSAEFYEHPVSADTRQGLDVDPHERPPVPPKDTPKAKKYARKRRHDSHEDMLMTKVDVEEFKSDVLESTKASEVERRNNVRRRYSQGGRDYTMNTIILSPGQRDEIIRQAWKKYR